MTRIMCVIWSMDEENGFCAMLNSAHHSPVAAAFLYHNLEIMQFCCNFGFLFVNFGDLKIWLVLVWQFY